MTLDLLTIGEAMAEISQSSDSDYRVGFAGDTFNTAVYCAKTLGENGNVSFFSRIGTDPLSTSFLAFAGQHALDISHVQRDPSKNIGIYSVSTDASGERSFHYWREQSAARGMFSADDATRILPPARITYLSGITLAILPPAARQRLIEQLQKHRESNHSFIAFDSNYRPRLWESKSVAQTINAQMWALADIALPSIDDELALFEEANEAAVVERFAQRSWKACAIKRGERGPTSPTITASDESQFLAADSVIDTTAAGDSFNGGYLAALLRGQSEMDCLLAGHALASRVVGVRGAIG